MENKILTKEEIEKKCEIYKDCKDGSYEACIFFYENENKKKGEK